MPSMPGPMELLIVAALALIIFGPTRLPEIARSIGKAVNEFRRQAADLKAEFEYELDEEDERPATPSPSPEPSSPAEPTPSPPAEPPQPSQDPDPAPDHT